MTSTKSITRDGKPAIKITCGCATHPTASAVLTGAVAEAVAKLRGAKLDERIHGFVLLANHPARMMRISNERKGIFAA